LLCDIKRRRGGYGAESDIWVEQEATENCVMRKFVICAIRDVLFLWSGQGVWDESGVWCFWGRKEMLAGNWWGNLEEGDFIGRP
jgi:hypothetical protein